MKKRWLLCCLLAAPGFGNDVPGQIVELGSFDRLEASGVSYVSGRLAVVDDTLNSLFIFDTGGRFLGSLESERLPAARAKFEDLAFHPGTKTYFAVGSHEGWTDESLRELSVLLEFKLDRLDAIDHDSVRQLPLWEGFKKLGLWKPKGMKVEGLAIDDSGRTLFVGLREPSDRARVYAVSLESLRQGEADVSLLFEFDAGDAEDTPYCISAMTWEPALSGLLIATSTEQEPSHRFLGNRLWFTSLKGRKPVLVWDRFDEGMKAEGLALGAGKLFIVYDNDQDDTNIPSRMRILPQREIRARIEGGPVYVTP